MSLTALSVKELHSGVIHKVGGRVKSWHKRWMVLRSDKTLQYYKDASKSALGTISLNDSQFQIRTGVPEDFNWPKNCLIENTLVIITTSRTYYMYAESLQEAKQWMKVIQDNTTIKNNAATVSTTLPSRYSKMSGNASQLEIPSAAMEPSRTPKQYKKKDRRPPTKRFNSAASDDHSGLDDDDTEGELDPTEFDQPSMFSSDSFPPIEGTYDLIRANQEEVSHNMNNNNKTEPNYDVVVRVETKDDEVFQPRNIGESVCINESLYDLVGRINAGEEENKETQENNESNDCKNQTELYEPVDTTNQIIHSKPPSIQNQPLPKVPTSDMVSKELYDFIPDNSPVGGVTYEDIDRQTDIKEADSSDDESVPIPSAMLCNGGVPPPVPQRNGNMSGAPPIPMKGVPLQEQETYDNAPSLPVKGAPLQEQETYDNAPSLPVKGAPLQEQETYDNAPSLPVKGAHLQEQETYDNAPSLPLKGHTEATPTKIPPTIPKFPVPVPRKRTNIKSQSVDAAHNQTVDEFSANDEIYDDIVVGKESNESQQGTDHSAIDLKRDEKRIHSATIGPTNNIGIEMFMKRGQEVNVSADENTVRKEIKSMIMSDGLKVLSYQEKSMLAETLREIEIEKQLASEERFKWERERLKLEEERRKFEEEKRKLEKELAKARSNT